MQARSVNGTEASFCSSCHSAYWFYAGFHEVHDTAMGGMESAEHVTPTALEWIEKNASGDNWYLHVNYWDPHTPYRVPEAFGNPFEKDPLPAWLTFNAATRRVDDFLGARLVVKGGKLVAWTGKVGS